MEDTLYWILAHGDKFLMWALVFVGGLAASLILKMLKDGTAKQIVERALTEVGHAVLAVAQTYVSAIKEASADGILTAQEKAEAKAKAIALAKQNIGKEGLLKLAKILGVDLDGWLGTKIEAAVATLKASTGKVLSTTETLQTGDVSKTTTTTTAAGPVSPQ